MTRMTKKTRTTMSSPIDLALAALELEAAAEHAAPKRMTMLRLCAADKVASKRMTMLRLPIMKPIMERDRS